jgi:hypothetical protein
MKIYVLSHDGNLIVDGQRVNTYRWVNVGHHQVKEGMTSTPVIPDDKAGSTVRYGIEGKGHVTLRVMEDGLLREISENEAKTQTIQIPRI